MKLSQYVSKEQVVVQEMEEARRPICKNGGRQITYDKFKEK